MLLLAHTWILKEFLGLRSLTDELLDLFTYNASPDLLPIHRGITSDITHAAPRSCRIPPEYLKAAFVQFHLLVDDIAHHGRIGQHPVYPFNPHSDGYTYVKGRPLMQAISDFQKSIGRETGVNQAAYQAHVIIEMSFDLALYRGEGNIDLIEIFCNALSYTVTNNITEFSRDLAWLYGVEERTIGDAIAWGKDTCTVERMINFMGSPARIAHFIDKFGLDRNNEDTWKGVRSLMDQGFDLVGDYKDFLTPTINAIKDFGFASPLLL